MVASLPDNPADGIRYEQIGHAVLLTIDRPRAGNSIDLPTAAVFAEAIARIRSNPDIRGVVITGRGRAHFLFRR